MRIPAMIHQPASASPTSEHRRSVARLLFDEGFGFDFFQAVRLLEKLAPERKPIGRWSSPQDEVVRFRALLSLSFPPSQIYEIERPSELLPLPAMTVAFLGLTGPSGVLPTHYTELLLRQDRDAKCRYTEIVAPQERAIRGKDKHALRAWLDLFNHRLISLFYRAWEKYRFYVPYERGEFATSDPNKQDPFTRCLFSFVGLGTEGLPNRLRVVRRDERDGEIHDRVLARIDDLALLHFSGFLSHRPRNAISLEAMLRDYFQLPVQVEQFRGQWLVLEPASQSRVGVVDGNCQMGVSLVAGERVWEVQSKFRIRLGPLRYTQFTDLLPDRAPVSQRKAFFLLCHLVRLYVGSELDFDVQVILRAADVPALRMDRRASLGSRLGWNTWLVSQPRHRDADDPVFQGEEVVWV